jgi:hypothetical protein
MIEATWIPSPFCWPGREGQRARYVIIHGTAGGSSAENIALWFQNPEAQACAHYVVGRDGAICQCVREADSAWSNGIISGPAGTGGDGIHHDSWWDSGINPNLLTISIELVKPHDDNSDTITAPQQASCFALVKDICARNGIPMRPADAAGGITGHFSMDPVNRSRCPGPFDWNALWSYLGQEGGDGDMPLQLTDPFAQAFFQDAGGRGWHCTKTGYYIGGAILDFYRQIQGAPRLPLSNEIKDIKDHPEVAYQIFEAGMLVFDPNHVIDAPPGFGRVFMVKFGDALVQNRLVVPIVTPLKNQLAQALTQIQALQAQLIATQDSTPLLSDYKDKLSKIHDLSDTTGDFLK